MFIISPDRGSWWGSQTSPAYIDQRYSKTTCARAGGRANRLRHCLLRCCDGACRDGHGIGPRRGSPAFPAHHFSASVLCLVALLPAFSFMSVPAAAAPGSGQRGPREPRSAGRGDQRSEGSSAGPAITQLVDDTVAGETHKRDHPQQGRGCWGSPCTYDNGALDSGAVPQGPRQGRQTARRGGSSHGGVRQGVHARTACRTR